MNKKLTFWVALNDTTHKIKQETNKFSKTTGIPAEVMEIPWGKMWEYIITSLKENRRPDVIQLGNSWVSILTSIGYLKDITSTFKKHKFIFNISPEIKNRYFAVPWFLDIALIFYNTLKLKNSERILNLQEIIRRCKRNSLILGGKKENILIQYLSSFIWKNGADYINKNKFNILEPQVYNGIAEFFNLINDYAIKDTLLHKYGDNIVDFFINEKGTFTTANTWSIHPFIKQYRKEKIFKATTFSCNTGNKCNFIGGSCLAITKNSKFSKEAELLIEFLLTTESQKRYLSKIGMLPAVQNSFEETVNNFIYTEAIKNAIDNGRTYPAVPYWGSFEQIAVNFIYNTLKKIKTNKFSIRKLKKDLQLINEQMNFLISLWKRN